MADRPAPAREALSVGDVVMLVRWQFWSWSRNLLEATRAATAVALMALAALTVTDIRRLRRVDWKPGGKLVVRVRRWWRTVNVPLTSELDQVVETYLAERDKMLSAKSGPLLATTSGQPISDSYFAHFFFGRMARRLGLHTPLQRLLRNFAARWLERDRDEDAVAAILGQGYRIRRRRIESVVQGRLSAVIKRQNPLRGMLRYVTMAYLPPNFGARFAVSVPLTSKPQHFVPRRGRLKSKPMPVDHPVFAALLAVHWPKEQAERKALGAKLALEYAAVIEPFVRSRRINGEQARALFGGVMKWEWYRTLARRMAKKSERKAERELRRERKRRRKASVRERREKARRPTRSERRLIAEIVASEWPIENKALLKFRRAMIVRYLPAVAQIIRAGRLTTREAAALFRTHVSRISTWMLQLERTGTFEPARLAAKTAAREAFECELEAYAEARPPGTTVTDAMQAYIAANPATRITLETARSIVYARHAQKRAPVDGAKLPPPRN